MTLRNGSSDVMVGDGPTGTTSTYAQNESWSYITDASEPNAAGIWDLGFVRLSWKRKPSFNLPEISKQPIQCQVGEASFFSRSSGKENWYDVLSSPSPSVVVGDASLTCDAKGDVDYRIRFPDGEAECVVFSREGSTFVFEAPASCGAEVFAYKVKGKISSESLVAAHPSAPFRITIQVP